MSDDIQAAFRRHLLTSLGDERDLIRVKIHGYGDHLVGARQLEIEIGAHTGPEDADVRILNVAPVLPEVCRYAIRTNRLADQGGLERVRLGAPSCLPERRDVVDVHIKSLVACSHIRPEYNFFTMKKLLLGIVLSGSVACATATPRATGVDTTPGASTSAGAVARFFAAVHAQDLQAMSLVWGTEKGSARDNMPRNELEKREVILQCYFDSDKFRILSESPTSETRHMVRVELERQGRIRTPVVYTVLGPGGRWFVENLDIAAVKDFCGMAPVSPGGF